jgi:hypothetical protein
MFNPMISSRFPVDTLTGISVFSSRRSLPLLRVLLATLVLMVCASGADARPPASQYVRPFGADAPWNVPVKNLPKHPQSDLYASRMYNNAPDRPGNINLNFFGYTTPVYYVEDATATYTVQGGYNINGTKLPWNPNWTAASGSDGELILLDPATGREWDLWQVSVSGSTINVSGGSLIGAGESMSGGSVGNYRTKENGWSPSRGVGIQYYAFLAQPEEVSMGAINHALCTGITNPSKTFYVAPATKLEHPGTEIANPIPEGMRFALNITDAEIESWVATKPAAYQKLARILARTLRDYGWFVTDTAGAAGFRMEDGGSAGTLWNAQGIDWTSNTARDLLDGLITQSRIYALVPSDQYPNQSLAPPNPPTGITAN